MTTTPTREQIERQDIKTAIDMLDGMHMEEPCIDNISLDHVTNVLMRCGNYIADLSARIAELEAEIERKAKRLVSLHEKLSCEQEKRLELEAENARLKAIEESALKVCGELDEIVLVMPYDYLDLPDGGNVPMHEQIKRMWSEVQILRNNVSDNNELRQQLAACQEEVARLKFDLLLPTQTQLAAEQLRNERLREAIKEAIYLRVKLYRSGDFEGEDDAIPDEQIALRDTYAKKWVKALSEPHDTAALDAYVEQKVSTAKLVSSGAVVGYKAAQIQIADLTRKLELAREALEKCSDKFKFYAAHHAAKHDFDKSAANQDMQRMCNDAISAIKEPTTDDKFSAPVLADALQSCPNCLTVFQAQPLDQEGGAA